LARPAHRPDHLEPPTGR